MDCLLLLDDVYVNAAARCRWIKAPTRDELTDLTHTVAGRIGRCLVRKGLLEQDTENSCLALDAAEEDPMHRLPGHSITYRTAVGPQAGHKAFTLPTLPAKARERNKLERLCCYISRAEVSDKQRSLTSSGKVRYELKTPYLDDSGKGRLCCYSLEFQSTAPPGESGATSSRQGQGILPMISEG